MTFADPFIAVKEDVRKALRRTTDLYQRWKDLQVQPITASLLKEELAWTTTELHNSLRSIEWDLEDVEDTISIVEKNPTKFKVNKQELDKRREFVDDTRNQVQCFREKLNYLRVLDKDKTAGQPLVDNLVAATSLKMSGRSSGAKYTRLQNQMDPVDSPERKIVKNTLMKQSVMLKEQDDNLDKISNSLGTLKTMSTHIAIELDEQAMMLDDLNAEVEHTNSHIDSAFKGMSKVMRLSNDKSQWIALGLLMILLIVIAVLFVIL